ncbi:hypothetical protein EVAR_7484_1 [Eumeta japonica]|uniref:Uncharacterized protein n=1 Tax=Eumeta variegata TaxID=151549 RepID=A0A4C1Y2U9_EUMVA|nr:hypothetical protein EVAR_7484_1 [Eumeta japonica]
MKRESVEEKERGRKSYGGGVTLFRYVTISTSQVLPQTTSRNFVTNEVILLCGSIFAESQISELKRGHGRFEDEERMARPPTAVTQENVATVEKLCRITCVELEWELDIGYQQRCKSLFKITFLSVTVVRDGWRTSWPMNRKTAGQMSDGKSFAPARDGCAHVNFDGRPGARPAAPPPQLIYYSIGRVARYIECGLRATRETTTRSRGDGAGGKRPRSAI